MRAVVQRKDVMRCSYNQCNLFIASHDPEKVQRGLEVFHAACLRKQKLHEQQEEQKKLNARVGKRHADPYYRPEVARVQ